MSKGEILHCVREKSLTFHFSCWILAFLVLLKLSDFLFRLLDLVDSLKKSYIVWQEIFDNGLKVLGEGFDDAAIPFACMLKPHAQSLSHCS